MRTTRAELIPALLSAVLTACGGSHEAPSPHATVVHPGRAPRVSPQTEPAPPANQPAALANKLVVVVVIDQMRFDFYDRFGPQWQHGFVRLRDQGRFFGAAYHEHALTETAPGHATIATGNDPARHGIVANRWLDRSSGARVNAVDDLTATILGNPGETGVSSATLLRESVGDWAQAHEPATVVVALALKDRAAILLGGKRPDAAVWYDDDFGGFTTSTAYADARPAWVDAYNAKARADALYGETGWTLSRPDADYGDSRRVTDPALVSTYSDYALTKRFPHTIDVPGKGPRNVVRDTPFGDVMTLELAREAIAAEHMGADAIPDLLLVGLSAGDYAGHRYGPESVEIHDYYLRMDVALGEFVADLDAQFGAENYTLVLTADHGVAPIPEYTELHAMGRFDLKEQVPKLLAQACEARGLSSPPTVELSHGVDLLFADAVPEADRAGLRAALAELLRADPRVADAWTRDELLDPTVSREYADAWRRTFHPERSSDILIQNAPGVVSYPEGTGHGTPYEYDQHVPLIVRGPGWAGVEPDRVATVDIAPTIAALLGVPVAEGVDGRPLPRD